MCINGDNYCSYYKPSLHFFHIKAIQELQLTICNMPMKLVFILIFQVNDILFAKLLSCEILVG